MELTDVSGFCAVIISLLATLTHTLDALSLVPFSLAFSLRLLQPHLCNNYLQVTKLAGSTDTRMRDEMVHSFKDFIFLLLLSCVWPYCSANSTDKEIGRGNLDSKSIYNF